MEYVQALLSEIYDMISEFIPFIVLFGIVFIVLCLFGMCNLFKKAGIEEWKALIPIYNLYYLWRIAGKYFDKVYYSTIITIILSLIVMVFATRTNMLIALIVPFFVGVWGIWLIKENAKVSRGLSRNFGHGIPVAIGLFLMTPLFLLILGYNNDEFVGKIK